jgi:hypothetical protein
VPPAVHCRSVNDMVAVRTESSRSGTLVTLAPVRG